MDKSVYELNEMIGEFERMLERHKYREAHPDEFFEFGKGGLRMFPADGDNTRYSFTLNGEEYLTGSIVRVTDEAKEKMGAPSNEVILTYISSHDYVHWFTTFKFSIRDPYEWGGYKIVERCTGYPIEMFVTEVVTPKTIGTCIREKQGIAGASYEKENAEKVTVPDEDPAGSFKKWLVYIGIMCGAMIFKDWYMKLIVWAIATAAYTFYRSAYTQAHTVYINRDDLEYNKKVRQVYQAALPEQFRTEE